MKEKEKLFSRSKSLIKIKYDVSSLTSSGTRREEDCEHGIYRWVARANLGCLRGFANCHASKVTMENGPTNVAHFGLRCVRAQVAENARRFAGEVLAQSGPHRPASLANIVVGTDVTDNKIYRKFGKTILVAGGR